MKFLVMVRPREGVEMLDPLEHAKESRKYFSDYMELGVIKCLYQFTSGKGSMAVLDIESEEEVWAILTASPGYGYVDYEIDAIVDGLAAFDQYIAMMEVDVAA